MGESLTPNFTQAPNIVFDFLLPDLSGAETKCLMYIIRHTYGYHKGSDRIALSQFEKGIKTKDGVIVDRGTGLSRKSIIEALKSLKEKEVITSSGTSQSPRFSLDESCNWCKNYTSTGVKITPELVEKLHPQNKIQNKTTKPGEVDPKEIAEFIFLFKELDELNVGKFYGNNNERKAAAELILYGRKHNIDWANIVPHLKKLAAAPYYPDRLVCFKPTELLRNWSRVQTYWERYKNTKQEKITSKPKVTI